MDESRSAKLDFGPAREAISRAEKQLGEAKDALRTIEIETAVGPLADFKVETPADAVAWFRALERADVGCGLDGGFAQYGVTDKALAARLDAITEQVYATGADAHELVMAVECEAHPERWEDHMKEWLVPALEKALATGATEEAETTA